MADLSGRELLREWEKGMRSVVGAAASVAGRAEMPPQLLEPLQRQFELVQDILERERKLQRDLAGRLLAPVDAVFDLLEQSAGMLRSQAEALETAGKAIQESAGIMKAQAELFEKTLGTARKPSELAKSVAGVEKKRPRKR